jgi:hypothetical protein
MQYFHLFWVPWDCLAFRKPRPLSTYTFALDVPHLGPLRSHRYVPEQRIWPQEADGSMDKAALRHRHIDTVKLLTIRCPWLCLPGQDRSFGRRQLRLTRVWTAQPDIRQPRSRLGEKGIETPARQRESRSWRTGLRSISVIQPNGDCFSLP